MTKKKSKTKQNIIVPPNVPGRYRTSCPPKQISPLLDHFRNLARTALRLSKLKQRVICNVETVDHLTNYVSLFLPRSLSLSPSLARSLPLSLSLSHSQSAYRE